jgi:hypothetical protein
LNTPFSFTKGYFVTVPTVSGFNHSFSGTQKQYAGFLLSFAFNGGLFVVMGLTF